MKQTMMRLNNVYEIENDVMKQKMIKQEIQGEMTFMKQATVSKSVKHDKLQVELRDEFKIMKKGVSI